MSIKRPSIIIGMVVATVLVAENLISGASAGVITPGLSGNIFEKIFIYFWGDFKFSPLNLFLVVDIAAASSDNELRPDHYRPFCGEILRACSAAKELVLPLNGSIFGKRSYGKKTFMEHS